MPNRIMQKIAMVSSLWLNHMKKHVSLFNSKNNCKKKTKEVMTNYIVCEGSGPIPLPGGKELSMRRVVTHKHLNASSQTFYGKLVTSKFT